jgi:hypothetical protein
MSKDPFSDPTSGGSFDAKALNGKLLLFTPTGYEENVSTVHGEKDAVRVNFVVIDEADPTASESFEDGLIFQGRLIGSLKPKVGKGMVIGRLGQEPTAKGNPAWVLNAATDAEKDKARAYLASTAPQL